MSDVNEPQWKKEVTQPLESWLLEQGVGTAEVWTHGTRVETADWVYVLWHWKVSVMGFSAQGEAKLQAKAQRRAEWMLDVLTTMVGDDEKPNFPEGS